MTNKVYPEFTLKVHPEERSRTSIPLSTTLSLSKGRRAKLILEDGTVFEGQTAGGYRSSSGEVVFTTGMVGYEQSLTDPSYAGQILVFTYPLIGNWGVPPKDFWESEKIQVSGVVISDLTQTPSHWQSEKTLEQWLQEENIPAIVGVDTRALTQKLRQKGVMLGKIIVGDQDVDFYNPNLTNLVAQVSPKEVKIYHPESLDRNSKLREESQSEGTRFFGFQPQNDKKKSYNSFKIALLNCGAKRNILRNLLARGATVYELPWDYDPFDNGLRIDGLVISNGPGDPKIIDKSIEIIKIAIKKKMPTFGICLGNQLLALAAGGNTYKLKFGHRAQNQPTIQVGTKRCFITTQNHGFAVDEKKLPDGFQRWFYNANDNTNEGIIHQKLPFFSVQFHPEANPGPKDTEWLFDYFFNEVEKRAV